MVQNLSDMLNFSRFATLRFSIWIYIYIMPRRWRKKLSILTQAELSILNLENDGNIKDIFFLKNGWYKRISVSIRSQLKDKFIAIWTKGMKSTLSVIHINHLLCTIQIKIIEDSNKAAQFKKVQIYQEPKPYLVTSTGFDLTNYSKGELIWINLEI